MFKNVEKNDSWILFEKTKIPHVKTMNGIDFSKHNIESWNWTMKVMEIIYNDGWDFYVINHQFLC